MHPASGWTEDTTETGEHQGGTERETLDSKNPGKIKLVCILSARILINVVAPMAVQLAGLPPEIVEALKDSNIDDALEKMADHACGAKGPIRKDNPVPKWKPFPKNPKKLPNKAPNRNKNLPASRWPPGAPRKG